MRNDAKITLVTKSRFRKETKLALILLVQNADKEGITKESQRRLENYRGGSIYKALGSACLLICLIVLPCNLPWPRSPM